MLVLRWEFDVCSAIVDIGFSNIVKSYRYLISLRTLKYLILLNAICLELICSFVSHPLKLKN